MTEIQYTPSTTVNSPSLTGFTGFSIGVLSGKTLQSPSPVLVKLKKDITYVSCRPYIT